MTSVLHDPWTGATVHDDALPSPIVGNDANGDYIIHRENGKSTYKAYEGGGSGLPEVTADDNGDVLTVVSGEWAKAAPSGGGGVLSVGIDAQTMTLDKTYAEIANADYAVLAVPEQSGGTNYALLVFKDDETYTVIFWMAGNEVTFVAESADGYPVYSQGGD